MRLRNVGRAFRPGGLSLVLLAAVALYAPRTAGQVSLGGSASANGHDYLVEFGGADIPHDLSACILALGARVIDTLPELKIAVVADLTDAAAATLAAQADVAHVTPDEHLPQAEPDLVNGFGHLTQSVAATGGADPTAAIAYPYQWNMRAIEANRAWAAGFLGSPDVRIAIIDTGIDPAHPDLADLIDPVRSTSFCPGQNEVIAQEFPGYPTWTDLSGHGTWVASFAASKGVVLAGVTSRSTLIAVKTHGPFDCGPGFGYYANMFRSIIYAANNGADVINLSQGTHFVSKVGEGPFFASFTLAVRYALQKGVSAVVVSAGNNGVDLDRGVNGAMMFCDLPGVLCVSATGPTDFGPQAMGPFINVDTPAFYTNYGASAIHVAAPGGNLGFDGDGRVVGLGTLFGACATTDRRFDAQGNVVPGLCSRNGFLFRDNLGTSGSAPHVSGLAALLVSQFGRGSAARVRAAILNSADDLGKPGLDPFYGRGRINVGRALGVR